MDKRLLYSGTSAAEIDRLAIDEHGYDGFALMSQAGRAAFAQLQTQLDCSSKLPGILVLCGSGNNGGDGYILGAAAVKARWSVTLVPIKPAKSADSIAAREEFLRAGGELHSLDDIDPSADFQAVVDGLLGIGLHSAPRAEIAQAIEFANALSGFKLALDVPSGVDADSGAAFSPCFRADLCVTFIVDKLGLHTGPALNYVGQVLLETLAVERPITDRVPHSAEVIFAKLPSRNRESHKGTYGHAVIAGACNGMLGAGLLAGHAALRAGAGKATLLSTSDHLDQAALYQPELMTSVYDGELPAMIHSTQALAIGPGLGTAAWGESLLDAVLALHKPMVIDADALTLLADGREIASSQCVLTPHPGEAAKLLDTSGQSVQENRLAAAEKIARQYNAVCVLKGAGTLVATEGHPVYLCDRGNPAMATAGMGDVLTGIIVALLAQGYDALEAAKTGVWWHAAVADFLIEVQGHSGLLAADVARGLSLSHAKLLALPYRS